LGGFFIGKSRMKLIVAGLALVGVALVALGVVGTVTAKHTDDAIAAAFPILAGFVLLAIDAGLIAAWVVARLFSL
jgi:hypothetical protein